MYTLTLYDTVKQRHFTVKFASPYLRDKWKKKHKVPYSKKLLFISEGREN